MKLICYKQNFLIYALIVMQVYFLTSCNTKSYNSEHQVGKIGFLGFYLDMDYLKVKSMMDSLLNISELHYFETTDVLGNKQKNLYHDFSGINPFFCAKVNLRGTYITDERLTSIQLTLCNRSKTGEQRFSYNCDLNELKRLFEFYKEEYGTPTLLDQGEKYDWLSKKISNVYFPGPKGRWVMDRIYFWERGNYIIYFDFGYPESLTKSDNPITESDVTELSDSTSAPIIFYVFTQDYIDKLLEKAGSIKGEELNKTNNSL
jgi:hypothetical protein